MSASRAGFVYKNDIPGAKTAVTIFAAGCMNTFLAHNICQEPGPPQAVGLLYFISSGVSLSSLNPSSLSNTDGS
jgi:hypothetical protein